jgi:riboflavin kinase / FMN adenylyltransferase
MAAVELIRGLYNLRAHQHGCVLTIGAFDGIHVGHQEMIRVLRERAREHRLPAALLSFEPTPREFFAEVAGKGPPPARLTRFREKFEALERFGVDRFVCLRFDERVRCSSHGEFVDSVLVKALGVRHIVVGHDFRFGRNNQGDVACLRTLAGSGGFEVTEVPPFEVEGERVSSSLIRAALGAGDLARAARLLGRPYRMTGKVLHGEKLGRRLGFPTANLRLHRRTTPLAGVFAIRVTGAGLVDAPGVASLGTRPAVNGKELLLEAHVFDFDGDLYRKPLHVDFIEFLREERGFANLDALVAQMQLDAAQARQILGS